MAQACEVLPSVINHPIALTTPTLIPGLSKTILNGAGWIKITFGISLNNQYAGVQYIAVALFIDAIIQPNSLAWAHIPQAQRTTIGRSRLFKPGAGQHTYEIRAYCNQADLTIDGYNANLIIDEPGY